MIMSRNLIELLPNCKRLIESNNYGVLIKVGKGKFVAVNGQENIIAYERGAVRAGIGRFDNLPSKVSRFGG